MQTRIKEDKILCIEETLKENSIGGVSLTQSTWDQSFSHWIFEEHLHLCNLKVGHP